MDVATEVCDELRKSASAERHRRANAAAAKSRRSQRVAVEECYG